MTTPATIAPAAPPERRFAEALPARRRVALAVALVLAPVALWRLDVGAEGIVGILFFAVLAVLAAVAAAAFLFLPSLLAKGGVGMGDVKLALLLGAALGRGVAVALLLGCLAASVAGVTLLVRHGSGARKTAVAFAPFLAFGAVAAIALGAQHAF